MDNFAYEAAQIFASDPDVWICTPSGIQKGCAIALRAPGAKDSVIVGTLSKDDLILYRNMVKEVD